MMKYIISAILFLSTTYISAQSHDTWHNILQQYVTNDGKVDYQGMLSEKAQVKGYLDYLSTNEPNKASKADQMAYWINLYNAATIKLILDHYPVKSIMDLDNGKTWDVKRVVVGNKKLSLNDIEHNILRKKYNDPRIHFAVNCAAKSCPKLSNIAWTGDNLDHQLDKMTREFVNNEVANSIKPNSISLSKIFQWYADDFGDLISFLNQYSKVKVSPKAKISYNAYDWALNRK